MKKPDETVYEEVTTTQNERIIPGRARRSPTRRSPTKVKWHSALRAEGARHSEERGDEEDAAERAGGAVGGGGGGGGRESKPERARRGERGGGRRRRRRRTPRNSPTRPTRTDLGRTTRRDETRGGCVLAGRQRPIERPSGASERAEST